MALAGGILALATVLRRLGRGAALSGFEILLGSVLWIEIALSSISWRMFGHYFISWVPAIALLSGFLFAEVVRLLRQDWLTGFAQGRQPIVLFSSLILGVALVSHAQLGQYSETISQVLFHRAEGIQYKDYLSNYVDHHTQSNDSVLTWPGNAWINFAAKRDAPVRLLFYPVFDAGTITAEQGKGYLEDLQAHKPALIIDCSDLQNEVPSLDAKTRQIQSATRDFLFNPPYIQQVFDTVALNYHVEVKTTKCTIYRKNP